MSYDAQSDAERAIKSKGCIIDKDHRRPVDQGSSRLCSLTPSPQHILTQTQR